MAAMSILLDIPNSVCYYIIMLNQEPGSPPREWRRKGRSKMQDQPIKIEVSGGRSYSLTEGEYGWWTLAVPGGPSAGQPTGTYRTEAEARLVAAKWAAAIAAAPATAAAAAEDRRKAIEYYGRQDVASAGATYYAFGPALVRAGAQDGRNAQVRLSAPVEGSYTGAGGSRQWRLVPIGTKVSVRWYADQRGRNGYGPNRQRRAEITVLEVPNA